MASNSVDKVAIYKALGDDIRLGMVKSIAASAYEVTSSQVVESCASLLNLSQPTISHHFAKLVASGVLLEQKQGSQKLYRINRQVLVSAGIDISKLINV